MESLDLQQLELIFYVLLGLILLTLAGLIVYVVIANRRERARLAHTYELESLVPRPALQVTGQILSLVRDEPGAPLKIEIGGKRFRQMEEIEDKQLRRQVVEVAMELVWFTGALRGGELAPKPLEQTYSWREDVRQDSRGELKRIRSMPDQEMGQKVGSPGAEPPRAAEREDRFLGMLSEMGQAPGAPERPNLASALQRRWAPKVSGQEEPHTFVEQIDAIVQRRIQLIPALANRDLKVRPGPDGGVRFVFEGQQYENLEDLPNLTAQQIIKDAIQEWDETT